MKGDRVNANCRLVVALKLSRWREVKIFDTCNPENISATRQKPDGRTGRNDQMTEEQVFGP